MTVKGFGSRATALRTKGATVRERTATKKTKETPRKVARQVTITMIQATRTGLLFSEDEELLEVARDEAEDEEKFEEEEDEVEGEIEAEVVAQVVVLVVVLVVVQVVAQVVELVDVVVDEAEVVEDMLAVDILSGTSLTLDMLLSLTFSPFVSLACTSLMVSSQHVKRIFSNSSLLMKSLPLW